MTFLSLLALLQADPDTQAKANQIAGMMAGMMGIFFIIWLIFAAFAVFCFWRIFVKAGMAGPLSLLLIVPAVGPLVVICILAFGEWKVIPAAQAVYPPAYPPPYPPAPPTV